MNIPDAVIRRRLANVYFLWGRGKTTIAGFLAEKYGFYVYSTDDSRRWHMADAVPEDQPYMCRDFMAEYGVKSFWELPSEVIDEREKHFLREMTPMVIADLIALAPQHRIILCEGDLDYETVAPVASHTVHLHYCGNGFDWFNRPDHADSLRAIEARADLTREEKDRLIQAAYLAVAPKERNLPEWVVRLKVKNIDWDDGTGVKQTAGEVESCFGFGEQ